MATPLHLDLEATATDGTVRFLLRLRNHAADPVMLTFRSGRRFEIVAIDATGAEAWRWSAGRLFTQAITEETLAGGAVHTYTAAWNHAPPGRYQVRATMAAGDATPAEATVTVAAGPPA